MISLLTSAMRGSVSLAALTTLPSSLVPDLVPSITSGAWHGVSLLVIHKYDLNICFSLPLYVPHHVGHGLDDAQLGLDQAPGDVHPRLHGVAELLVQVLPHQSELHVWRSHNYPCLCLSPYFSAGSGGTLSWPLGCRGSRAAPWPRSSRGPGPGSCCPRQCRRLPPGKCEFRFIDAANDSDL